MISNQVIQQSIDELRAITRVELCVFDDNGAMLASTMEKVDIEESMIQSFMSSPADSQVVGNHHLLKISEDGDLLYVLMASGVSEDTYMVGKIAVAQIRSLSAAYKERFDKGNFFQNLIMDNLLLVDIHNQARKFKIETTAKRVVYLIETPVDYDGAAGELLKGLFLVQNGDYITTVDDNNLVLIKYLESGANKDEIQTIADTIVDMMSTEVLVNVRVSYGTVVSELKDVSKSYKEARMAMDVSHIFYQEKRVIAYDSLGIGRLIYQLPVNLCKLFVKEIFGDKPLELDEKTLNDLDIFFENNLNVSETARKLFLHRNTLVYRIEKIKQMIGLDLRNFDDALTFKIAMMVVSYVEYLEKEGK